jgi:hypothetical protein
VDVHTLIAERKRVAEELRSTLTCLGVLRASLISSLTAEAREHLLSPFQEQMSLAHQLGEKLLKLDTSIQQLRQREVALCPSPLLSAPLDF